MPIYSKKHRDDFLEARGEGQELGISDGVLDVAARRDDDINKSMALQFINSQNKASLLALLAEEAQYLADIKDKKNVYKSAWLEESDPRRSQINAQFLKYVNSLDYSLIPGSPITLHTLRQTVADKNFTAVKFLFDMPELKLRESLDIADLPNVALAHTSPDIFGYLMKVYNAPVDFYAKLLVPIIKAENLELFKFVLDKLSTSNYSIDYERLVLDCLKHHAGVEILRFLFSQKLPLTAQQWLTILSFPPYPPRFEIVDALPLIFNIPELTEALNDAYNESHTSKFYKLSKSSTINELRRHDLPSILKKAHENSQRGASYGPLYYAQALLSSPALLAMYDDEHPMLGSVEGDPVNLKALHPLEAALLYKFIKLPAALKAFNAALRTTEVTDPFVSSVMTIYRDKYLTWDGSLTLDDPANLYAHLTAFLISLSSAKTKIEFQKHADLFANYLLPKLVSERAKYPNLLMLAGDDLHKMIEYLDDKQIKELAALIDVPLPSKSLPALLSIYDPESYDSPAHFAIFQKMVNQFGKLAPSKYASFIREVLGSGKADTLIRVIITAAERKINKDDNTLAFDLTEAHAMILKVASLSHILLNSHALQNQNVDLSLRLGIVSFFVELATHLNSVLFEGDYKDWGDFADKVEAELDVDKTMSDSDVKMLRTLVRFNRGLQYAANEMQLFEGKDHKALQEQFLHVKQKNSNAFKV